MTEPILYRIDVVPDSATLEALYRSVGWPQADTPEDLHAAVERTGWVATAWHQDLLVGMARVFTDFLFVAYFQELLVHPEYQHQGVGKEILDLYDRTFSGFPFQVAVTDVEWARQKLSKRGFRTEPDALSRARPYPAWTKT